MIPSLYTIDFIHGPEVARMLDAGEMPVSYTHLTLPTN